MTRNLEIGGGLCPTPGWLHLDRAHGRGEWKRNVEDGIPLPDESVGQARCSHLLEHVQSGRDRIFVFNEVWRVLVPGGTFEIVVPLFGGWGAIADPTHVSFWVKESFDYFTGDIAAAADYGIKRWDWVSWRTGTCNWGTEGQAVLRKPLP